MQRSFYYWRSQFSLTAPEQQALTGLQVQKLYIRFFDVVWDDAAKKPGPVAKINFSAAPAVTVVPVLFITPEVLLYTDSSSLNSLAKNINGLLASIAANNQLQLGNEVQIDCDWTQSTRDRYFHLLQQLQKASFFQNKITSATIRLHQLKFVALSGVPPVAKGLLMCYNMGNIRQPQTANSIIDAAELKKYIRYLKHYHLPLDVALPIFDWWVLFDGAAYKGIVREFDGGEIAMRQRRIQFEKDTVLNGRNFKKGEWLRYESSDPVEVERCARLISEQMDGKERTVILYHLSPQTLARYQTHDLQNLFDAFH